MAASVDAKVEHLKLIQGMITRLAGNSFLLKGWTVTLMAALFTFAAKDSDRSYVIIAWLPVLVFAVLDSYYLWQERLFRDLYQQIAAADTTTFSMDMKECLRIGAFFSGTILLYCGAMTIQGQLQLSA